MRLKKKRKKPKGLLMWFRRLRAIAVIAVVAILLISIVQASRNFFNQGVEPATALSQQEEIVATGIAREIDAYSEMAIAQLEPKFTVPEPFVGTTIAQVQSNSEEKVIALTFDDGPWGQTTLEVLDILKENNIKGTFFWIGKHLQVYPEVARQVVADGHAIANHTWSHKYHRFSEKMAAKEIDDTAELIYKTTGVKTAYFRPPGGILKNGLVAYAHKHNYAVMMWSVDSADARSYHPAARKLVNNVLKAAKPGGIVLLHDGGGDRSTTVQALPQIIKGLQKQGYKFVTLPELLEMQSSNNETHQAWKQETKPFIKPVDPDARSLESY